MPLTTYSLPAAGFLRLPHIIGPDKQAVHSGHYSSLQKHLVGRGQIRPVNASNVVTCEFLKMFRIPRKPLAW